MLQFPYVVQACPVCGRPARVYLEYLNRRVTCLHCGGTFTARDPAAAGDPQTTGEHPLLRRATRLLELAARKTRRRRGPAHQELASDFETSSALASVFPVGGRCSGFTAHSS